MDRRAKLHEHDELNGVDFVEVRNPEQTQLRVHFIKKLPDKAALRSSVAEVRIIGGETIPTVAVDLDLASWGKDAEDRPWLDIVVDAPGDFSTYTLRVVTFKTLDSRDLRPQTLDRYFDHVTFSFKVNCPSLLDCEPLPEECPPLEDTAPPIDYLAKDFQSFKKALTDFSALRYPKWQERSEADFGVMFMEALSSVADDLSYQQDRIAAEAWLETATQRRSLVRLARLVDYEPKVATAAHVLLQLEIQSTGIGLFPAGVMVSGSAPDGAPVEFETGTGLDDETQYRIRAAWSSQTLKPYRWDDSEQCLPAGATEMWITAVADALVDQWLLIDTAAVSTADRPRRQIVKITKVVDSQIDPLANPPTQVVRVAWDAKDALKNEHDLNRTSLSCNLVPATHGRRYSERFVTTTDKWTDTPSLAHNIARATVRSGANGSVQFLHTLRRSRLAWLAQPEQGEAPRPEIRVTEASLVDPKSWGWRRRLLDGAPFELAFTVDPVRYRSTNLGLGTADYDGGDGDTIRFGDGTLGAIPDNNAVFDVVYRCGGGARGNVAADVLTRLDPTSAFAGQVTRITNPLPATGGRDEESADQVREMAPQQFRAEQYRAVRAEDYEKAAIKLSWVQRAGARFRYTGSWLTVFTAVDPKAEEAMSDDEAIELTELLDRYRLAGYEAFALEPRFASLDLDIKVCVRPDAFRGEVERALLVALDTRDHLDGTRGFFHPDQFTFGQPLERSRLEAAIQEVHGVDGVTDVSYRRRGHTPGYITMLDTVEIAQDEIVRVDHDPSRPECGSVRLELQGGK